jgi:hypothetical protein
VIDVCVVVPTGFVLIANVAVDAPAGTTTLDGTAADEEPEARATVVSLENVAARVTVPVDELPPRTLEGDTETDASWGSTRSVFVCDEPFNAAVIVTEVSDATGEVVTLNEMAVVPAATVTLAGTVTADDDDVRATVVFDTTGALSVIVPVAGNPPTTEAALIASDCTENGTDSTVATPRPSYSHPFAPAVTSWLRGEYA